VTGDRESRKRLFIEREKANYLQGRVVIFVLQVYDTSESEAQVTA